MESGKYPQFKGNVASVYTNPFCHGGASNNHYGGNSETYMDIGEALGRAMVGLLKLILKNVEVGSGLDALEPHALFCVGLLWSARRKRNQSLFDGVCVIPNLIHMSRVNVLDRIVEQDKISVIQCEISNLILSNR